MPDAVLEAGLQAYRGRCPLPGTQSRAGVGAHLSAAHPPVVREESPEGLIKQRPAPSPGLPDSKDGKCRGTCIFKKNVTWFLLSREFGNIALRNRIYTQSWEGKEADRTLQRDQVRPS